MTKGMALPPLDAAIEDAMRASITRWGVLVPVVRDQDGQVIDGHVRVRLAAEAGVPYPERHVTVADSAEARDLRLSLNADRRQLTVDQRRALVGDLREQGHSTRAIAGALGTSKSTVQRDVAGLSHLGQLAEPDTVRGLDGRERPARAVEREDQDDDLPPWEPALPAGKDRADAIARQFDQRYAAPAAPTLPAPVEDGPEPRWRTGRGTVTVRRGQIEAAFDALGSLALTRDEAHEIADVFAAAVQRADLAAPAPF